MLRLPQTDFFQMNKLVSVQRRAPQEPFPEHCHSFHELVVVQSGCAIHLTDGCANHISRGSIFYLGENDSHMFDQMNNLCIINVLFRPEAFHHSSGIQKMLSESCHLNHGNVMLNAGLQQQCKQLLTQIEEENCKQDEYSQLMVESLFSQLTVMLWRDHNQPSNLTKFEQDDQLRLVALINHINENYHEKIDWDALSENFEIPLRTLNRKILEHTGLTPNNYLGRIRLCQASWMLSHTQKTVTDIAFECGFNDGNYFSSKFHNALDMTPLQYRKLHKRP